MLKHGLPVFALISLAGCAQLSQPVPTNAPANTDAADTAAAVSVCEGSVELAPHLAEHFTAIEDAELLNQALGEPEQGKLCQGQVYEVNPDAKLTIHRAWNSTNPYSQFGKWWAFDQPAGKVADYREDYEICYQWSPLDKLVSCELKAGTKVVVGNGQSAKCSQYLTYGTSEAQQIYLVDAEAALTACEVLDAEFSWK